MKNIHSNEAQAQDLLKALAKQYVQKKGMALHQERVNIDEYYAGRLQLHRSDAKVRTSIAIKKRGRNIAIWTSAAASIVVILLASAFMLNMPNNLVVSDDDWASAPTAMDSEPQAIMPVSLPQPEGWNIVYIDHDGDLTIFHIEGHGTNMAVIVTAGSPLDADAFEDFRRIEIAGTVAHLRTTQSHSILAYEQDGVQWILTTPYDYNDLIALAEYWL